MMKSCKTCVFALDYEFSPSCEKCFHHSNWLEKPKTVATQPMTNADHIRSMTDEELANFIVFHTGYNDGSGFSYYNFLTGEDDIRDKAEKNTLEWLKQPKEEKKE